MCVGVFRPSIFIFSTIVSNVPLTFSCREKDARIEDGKKKKHSLKCKGGVGSVAVVVVGV